MDTTTTPGKSKRGSEFTLDGKPGDVVSDASDSRPEKRRRNVTASSLPVSFGITPPASLDPSRVVASDDVAMISSAIPDRSIEESTRASASHAPLALTETSDRQQPASQTST